MDVVKHAGSSHRRSRSDSDFDLIFIASFVAFLVVAVLAQLLNLKWRLWFPGAEGDASMIQTVRHTVHSLMPYLN